MDVEASATGRKEKRPLLPSVLVLVVLQSNRRNTIMAGTCTAKCWVRVLLVYFFVLATMACFRFAILFLNLSWRLSCLMLARMIFCYISYYFLFLYCDAAVFRQWCVLMVFQCFNAAVRCYCTIIYLLHVSTKVVLQVVTMLQYRYKYRRRGGWGWSTLKSKSDIK